MGGIATFDPATGETVFESFPEQPPNNPGNPYFGKAPKTPKDFWGLILAVYIARAGNFADGLDRQSRLLLSRRAAPIIKVIDSADFVDPDDKGGDFLRCLGILTATNHEDASGLLVESAEANAIMAAWE